jgi:hypothetical protein
MKNIEEIIKEENNYSINYKLKNLIEFIKKYEGLSKTESKLFGEVFTPQALIEEMLDTLPADVWTNKDLKWLDPAVGIGNFPAAILKRLMSGLSSVIVDEDERRKWVLEQMIYMGDISTKNLFLLYQLFDANNSFKLNVFRGDFLSDKFDKQMVEWGLDGFDLVVGNPPYNDGDKSEQANKLYPKFIYKSINLLKKDGYCLMITPTGWFSNTADIGKGNSGISILREFKKKNLIYLNPNSFNIKNEYFNGVGSTFCYFLVKNNNLYKGTSIEGSIVDINKFDSLPRITNVSSFDIFKKYLSIVNNFPKFNWIDQNHNLLNEESKIQTDILKYKSYHTPAKNGTFVYSSNKHPNNDDIKIIISVSGKYLPYIDYGNVGFSSMCMAIIDDKENIEEIYQNLNSKFYKFLIENNKFSGFNPRKFILTLPRIKNLKNDLDYYKLFDLTQDEIKEIEKTRKK